MNENDLVSGETREHEHAHEEQWRAVLMGVARGLGVPRRLVGWMPAGPRCKLCFAPLRPPGSVVLRLVNFGPSRLNRRLCRACFRAVEKNPGGAEIELSFLFADVRGSTSLADRIPAQEFSQLISRFYGTAARMVDKWDGLVDKFVGDEVVALFIPGLEAKTTPKGPSGPPDSCCWRPETTAASRGSRLGPGYIRASPTSDASARTTPATSPRLATR